MYAVFDSLSLDFIAVSFALLCEGAAFEEIGKCGIWASGNHLVSTPTTFYYAITTDTSHDRTWMHRVFGLLAARADANVVEGLSLQSFEMATQHDLDFCTLQSGLYV